MRRAFDTVLLMLAGLAIWQAMHWAAPFALTSPAGTVARLRLPFRVLQKAA